METFETPGDVSLQIRIPSGRVTVATTDEPRTTVEIVPVGRRGQEAAEQIRVSHDDRGGRHIVTVEQQNKIEWGPIQISWGGDVEIRVICPAGSELELNGASTDFKARGRYGRVSARTASGDLRIGEVTGKLEIKTASGDVDLERLEAESAALVTVSGDVEVGYVEGDLTLRTVSGDVKLGVVRGPVGLSTTSGDVDLRSLEAGELRMQSVSGDARVGIGRGTRIWIDASSVSGDMSSELTMGDETEAEAEESESSGKVVPVHVKTVSGDVTIVRAPAPVA
jgi:DUF4097 and DUF4098 domain-containing protein YvlB